MNDATLKQQKRYDLFENASIPKAFFSLAVPTIISQIIAIIYNYADTWFVGRTNNENAVAAIGIAMPVFIILTALCNLFGVGGASAIARFLGQKRIKDARHTFAFCFYGALLTALIYALVIFVFMKPLMYAVGASDETYEYIKQYVTFTMVIGAFPTILNQLFGHLIRSVGASKEASIGMSFGVALNILLDPLFMFVILPKGMEVMGVALATVLSNLAATTFFLIYIIRKRKEIEVFTLSFKDVKVKDGIAKNVLLVGFPAALQTSLAMVSNIFANKLMLEYGISAQAGLGIAKKINTLAFNIILGISQGMLPFIAYNYASANYQRMKKGSIFTGLTSLIFSLCVITLFIIFAKEFNQFFIGEEETVAYGTKFLRVIAIAVPFCAVSYLINTIFQACGKRSFSLVVSILRKGVFDIPLMVAFKASVGMMGILYATPVAEAGSIVVAITLLVIFLSSLLKNKKEDEEVLSED